MFYLIKKDGAPVGAIACRIAYATLLCAAEEALAIVINMCDKGTSKGRTT